MMGVNNQIMNGMDACANFALKTFPFLSILQDPEKKNETADPTNIEELNEFIEKNGSDEFSIELEETGNNQSSGSLLEDDDDKLSENTEEGRRSIQEDTAFDVVEEKHEHYPESVLGWIWYVLAWPYEIVFYYTVPPVKGKYKYQFLASFFMSLVWLGVFSTFMVKWTEKIGCILGVEDAIMGVTFLAIGTSMPDCLTSIFVARTGRGNMAVCNALGSNVFDILLALSLPWAVSTVLSGTPVTVASDVSFV